KYVLWQLLVGMILVTAGLTCVIWLSQSLRFVEMIINRGLPVGTFTYLTMLLLPNFLSIIMPFALFTVVVFTYNKLITDRELVIMRSAGLSQITHVSPAVTRIIPTSSCHSTYLVMPFIAPGLVVRVSQSVVRAFENQGLTRRLAACAGARLRPGLRTALSRPPARRRHLP
ncbi:MAG TPA: LptF/LptG family permease, partial [Rhodospirillales bacterium]|nr:LptF/LptG family permease [Rhodospirillales bacterium]